VASCVKLIPMTGMGGYAEKDPGNPGSPEGHGCTTSTGVVKPLNRYQHHGPGFSEPD
jgi:hypothetical protein